MESRRVSEGAIDPWECRAAIAQRIEAHLELSAHVALREAFAERVLAHPLPTISVLPGMAAAACGVSPHCTDGIAASGLALVVATRWWDDQADRDRDGALWQALGVERTTITAAGALNLAWSILVEDSDVPREVLSLFGETCGLIAQGQDLDLGTHQRSVTELWDILRHKTAAGYAYLMAAGSRMAGAENETVQLFWRIGEHLGVAVQLLDDLDGIFAPTGAGDLASQKRGNAVLVHYFQLSGKNTALDDQGLLAELLASGSHRAVLQAAWREAATARELLATVPLAGEQAALGRQRIDALSHDCFRRLPEVCREVLEA